MSESLNAPGVVNRVGAVLTAVAGYGSDGARLVDIAESTAIARPTVHRLLADLAAIGYVEQLSTKRYRLGPELFLLGLAAPSPGWDMAALRVVADGLAQASGDTVYVAMKQFDGVHYLLRTSGTYPIRTHVVEVGDTKPFTASYAGIALLAGMDESDRERALANRSFDAPESSLTGGDDADAMLRRAITEVQTRGYCYGTGIVMPGVAGMAAPVTVEGRPPYLAITISAVDDRLPRERAEALAPLLIDAVHQLSSIISTRKELSS